MRRMFTLVLAALDHAKRLSFFASMSEALRQSPGNGNRPVSGACSRMTIARASRPAVLRADARPTRTRD
jgi:hypothetical protein